MNPRSYGAAATDGLSCGGVLHGAMPLKLSVQGRELREHSHNGYSSRARWAAVLLALAGNVVASDRLALRFGEVDFDPLRQPAVGVTPAPSTAAGKGLRMVQFDRALVQSDLDELADLGLQPLQYYPEGAYLVWGDEPALGRALGIPGMRWAGDFAPEWKRAASLRDRQGLIDQVLVHFHNDGDLAALLDEIGRHGGQLLRHASAQPDGRFHEALLRIDASRLDALAAIPQVLWIGYQSASPLRDDEMSAQIVAGNVSALGIPEPGYLAFLDGLGLTGAGVVWAITDDGIDLGHPEFQGRVSGGYNFPGCPTGSGPGADTPSGGHGTHVAGIVAAGGVGTYTDAQGFGYGIGMAPEVQLFAQNPLCGPPATWPPAGGWQVISQTALAGGAIGSNASWTTSEGVRHGYQASERLFDFAVRDGNFDTPELAEPFYYVFSAGNSGPNPATLTSPKEAKNVISVGASMNFRSGPVNGLAGFSSRGPAVDGRVLPTLIAPGQIIASTRRRDGGAFCNVPIPGTDEQYSYCMGTSMAAPHVSGLATLLVEWWRARHAGLDPSPAMLKALLIEGARPLDGRRVVPDDAQGWGLAGIPRLLGPDALAWYAVDQTALLDEPGQIHRYAVRPADPTQTVRLLLSWSDAPGAIGANPALVNDLDLRVRRAQSIYSGNQFGLDGSSVPGGQPDRLNNVEAVFLDGDDEALIMSVLAHALPGDGVPYIGDDTDQDYALLCSNCIPIKAFDAFISAPADPICAPATANYGIEIVDIGGLSDPVELSIDQLPDGLSASIDPLLPAVLPAQISIQISGSEQVDPGSYLPGLRLTAGALEQLLPLPLSIAARVPEGIIPTDPPAETSGVELRPTLRWTAVDDELSYRVEMADEPDFVSPLIDQVVHQAEYTVQTDLTPSTTWYWRVTASNACGSGPASAPQSFTTRPPAGSCPAGQRPMPLLRDDVEPSGDGWSHYSVLGPNNWSISSDRNRSPDWSWKGRNGFGASDQRLLSPQLRLPAGESAYLSFWHWFDMELRDQQLCWDGGQLFLADPGNPFVAIAPERYLSGSPLRQFSAGNPAEGTPAWCGNQDFSQTVVDLGVGTGQPTRVGFRLSSDNHGAREGWYIDDLEVYSCVPEDLIFRNGLGTEAR